MLLLYACHRGYWWYINWEWDLCGCSGGNRRVFLRCKSRWRDRYVKSLNHCFFYEV